MHAYDAWQEKDSEIGYNLPKIKILSSQVGWIIRVGLSTLILASKFDLSSISVRSSIENRIETLIVHRARDLQHTCKFCPGAL